MRPLFDVYPALKNTLPICPLATLPTPVEALKAMGSGRYVKRDDLTAALYGGNKVRKLEFLLAQAKAEGRKKVMTFGAAGSNHALATSIYAEQEGLQALPMLLPQHNAHGVRRNLLRQQATNAVLHYFETGDTLGDAVKTICTEQEEQDGIAPLVIPPGGSSPVGALGFVNAAFELYEQISDGLLPEPDVLYVASGTMGTWVGLLVGMTALGMKTRIEAIAVTEPPFSDWARAQKFFHEIVKLLQEKDTNFPLLIFPEDRCTLRTDFFGEEYALYTPEGMEAVQVAKEEFGLKLEGTYTGKAFAAFLADHDADRLDGKTALFWNTYNSADLTGAMTSLDYHDLPEGLHQYFQQDVQPLDQ